MLPRERTPEQLEKARLARAEHANQRRAAAAATVDSLMADAGAVPSYARAHAAKARQGRVGSLIALKCLECCCWEKREVAACTVTTCPLYPLRPYSD